MTYPDLELVDKLEHEAYAAAGFTYTDRFGEEQVDDAAIKEAVYTRMLDHHVVDEPKGMTKGAVTAHELYQALIPGGPGAKRQTTSPEEGIARDRLMRKVWTLANAGVTGYVNRRVEAEGFSLIMCEAPVARTYRSEETGRSKPVTEPGRFLTDHSELIEAHSTLPKVAKLVKAAEGVAKHMAMATRRHPELAPVVTRQIKGAVRQSQAALGAATTGASGLPADGSVASS